MQDARRQLVHQLQLDRFSELLRLVRGDVRRGRKHYKGSLLLILRPLVVLSLNLISVDVAVEQLDWAAARPDRAQVPVDIERQRQQHLSAYPPAAPVSS